jgi:hypothetical protein
LDDWAYVFDERPITVAEIVRELQVNQRLREAVPDWLGDVYSRDFGGFRKALGEALARQRDAQYGVWRLERAGENRRKVALWRVTRVTPEVQRPLQSDLGEVVSIEAGTAKMVPAVR